MEVLTEISVFRHKEISINFLMIQLTTAAGECRAEAKARKEEGLWETAVADTEAMALADAFLSDNWALCYLLASTERLGRAIVKSGMSLGSGRCVLQHCTAPDCMQVRSSLT